MQLPSKQGRIETFVTHAWMKRGVFSALAAPVSLIYYLLVQFRRALYAVGLLKSFRLPVPVIVVGNIFIGGTGKTPFVIWLIGALKQAGFRPGVISRGYGSQGDDVRMVSADSAPQEAGDEPLLIAMHGLCPVAVGRKRADAARLLLRRHPEVNVIVSDDGLQHYALARDLEIMLFDARGMGNGWMLPAGPLREPASRSADFLIFNLESDAEPPGFSAGKATRGMRTHYRMHLVPGPVRGLADPAQIMQLRDLARLQQDVKEERKGRWRILAAAGIGNPGRFFSMLRTAGLTLEEMPLPDHYAFSDNPFADASADMILITEKDAVKCRQIEEISNDPRIRVVPVQADIDAALADRIVEKLRGYTTA